MTIKRPGTKTTENRRTTKQFSTKIETSGTTKTKTPTTKKREITKTSLKTTNKPETTKQLLTRIKRPGTTWKVLRTKNPSFFQEEFGLYNHSDVPKFDILKNAIFLFR